MKKVFKKIINGSLRTFNLRIASAFNDNLSGVYLFNGMPLEH